MFRDDKAPKPSQAVLAEAMRTAQRQKKNIFLHFSASWCGWCHLLEKGLTDPKVKAAMEAHFVLISLDTMENGEKKVLENAGSAELMAKLGGAQSGLPFLVFMDAKGKKLSDSNVMPGNQNIGCPAAPEEVKAFGELLRQTAPRMTEAQFKTILDWFTANAPKR